MALESINKLGFIDRSLLQPMEDDLKFKRWKKINTLIRQWILNTIELLTFFDHEDESCENHVGWTTSEISCRKRASVLWIELSNYELQAKRNLGGNIFYQIQEAVGWNRQLQNTFCAQLREDCDIINKMTWIKRNSFNFSFVWILPSSKEFVPPFWAKIYYPIWTKLTQKCTIKTNVCRKKELSVRTHYWRQTNGKMSVDWFSSVTTVTSYRQAYRRFLFNLSGPLIWLLQITLQCQ